MENPIEGKFNLEVNQEHVENAVEVIAGKVSSEVNNKEVLKTCLSLIDLTTLNPSDSVERGKLFAQRVNNLHKRYPNVPNVASICVYPALVAAVNEELTAKEVKIASVAAGFPASQTFINIKLSECQMCIESGAHELDVVISLGYFLQGDYFTVFSELKQIKEVAEDAQVKVILETGAIPTLEEVRLASFLAMEAGADFIKTSTGKTAVSATPQAVYVMCQAIKDYHEATGRMVGIKPSGGMVSSSDAVLYYLIVQEVLGEKWLNNQWFRFGASRLADSLLSDIMGETIKYFSD